MGGAGCGGDRGRDRLRAADALSHQGAGGCRVRGGRRRFARADRHRAGGACGGPHGGLLAGLPAGAGLVRVHAGGAGAAPGRSRQRHDPGPFHPPGPVVLRKPALLRYPAARADVGRAAARAGGVQHPDAGQERPVAGGRGRAAGVGELAGATDPGHGAGAGIAGAPAFHPQDVRLAPAAHPHGAGGRLSRLANHRRHTRQGTAHRRAGRVLPQPVHAPARHDPHRATGYRAAAGGL